VSFRLANCDNACFPAATVNVAVFDVIQSNSVVSQFRCGPTRVSATAVVEPTALAPTPEAQWFEVPSEFTAAMRISMIESNRAFTVYETFSASAATGRTSVVTGQDRDGRMQVQTYMAMGAMNTTFVVESTGTGLTDAMPMDPASGALRIGNLVTATQSTCTRAVFDAQTAVVAGSVMSLLLMGNTTGTAPQLKGNFTVNGVVTQLWEQVRTTPQPLRVSWYVPFGEALPRRIVLRGVGSSPLFAHHAFVQSSTWLSSVAARMCTAFFGGDDEMCDPDGVNADYQHVIDLVSVVPTASATDLALPDVCLSSDTRQVCADSDSINPALAVVLLIFMCIMCVLVTRSVMRRKMANREVEFEAELKREVRRAVAAREQELLGDAGADSRNSVESSSNVVAGDAAPIVTVDAKAGRPHDAGGRPHDAGHLE
jgi:hypothetical protein